MNSKRRILLLSYKFPPYSGVGARRWALFADEFVLNNINVYVVCYNWKENFNSYKLSNLNEKNIFRLKDPISWLINTNNLFKKYFHKIGFYLMKTLDCFDEADFFYKWNKKKIKNLITKNNIDLIIATGGPFSTNYHASRLKDEFQNLKLIQDLRDTWTQVFFWEFPEKTNYSDANYLNQFNKEKISLNKADAIVNVCEKESELVQKSHPKIDSNYFYTILNGYNRNDEIYLNKNNKNNYFQEGTVIAHFGTLSFGRDKELFNFLNVIKKEINNKNIFFYLFGKIDDITKNLILNDNILRQNVKIKNAVPQEEMHQLMANCDIHLVVNDVVFYYTMGSKFYDAILHKKPILLISKNSTLSELVCKYKLGWHTENSIEENKKVIEAITSSKVIKKFSYAEDFDVLEYSVQNRAKEYINLINSVFKTKKS
jgi:hypothetical protein